MIRIPYEAIVPIIPKQFIKKVEAGGLKDHSLSLRKAVVLEQLAAGSVKVALSALRANGPNGLFISGQDHQLIDLPLKEVLAQLPARTLPRREQRQVVVPDDIADVFGPEAAGVRLLDKKQAVAHGPAATPAPAAPGAATAPSKTGETGFETRFTRGAAAGKAKKTAAAASKAGAKPAPKPPPPAPPPPVSLPQPEAGETLAIPLADLLDEWPEPVQLEIAYQNLTQTSCQLPVTEVIEGLKRRKLQYPWKTIRSWISTGLEPGPSPHGEVLLDLPVKSVMSRFFAYQANKPTAGKPAEQPAPAPTSPLKPSQPIQFSFDPAEPHSAPGPKAQPPAGATLELSVQSASAQWPEEVRNEIKDSADATLHVPLQLVEQGLKQGKISFPWQQVRDWIQPALKKGTSHGEVTVELPLPILAPLFLQGRRMATGRKTEVPTDIPDIFSGGREALPTAAVVPIETKPAQPAPAPAPARRATPVADQAAPAEPAPAAQQKPGQNIAEIFGQPNKKNWTPNEIVHETNRLPNVAGAMIALQDGLLVAGCMPPNWKTETVAAFVPQIFGRLRQYARDLDMGELTSVSFGVQQGTLEIFNAGIIYFAALSRPGEALPIEELTTIARELSRHTK